MNIEPRNFYRIENEEAKKKYVHPLHFIFSPIFVRGLIFIRTPVTGFWSELCVHFLFETSKIF